MVRTKEKREPNKHAKNQIIPNHTNSTRMNTSKRNVTM